MTTVLLWGDCWWLPQHQLPVPFSDPAQAADMLATAWPDRQRHIRLIYQPEDFVTVPVSCPNGNRDALTCALAEDHPVMLHPGHVWSYEPILPAGDGFSTLLHYETAPALFALVHQLRDHGFTVTAVWPMASWLNGLPPDLSPSGAMTICALHTDRFYLYRHSAGGTRAVRTGHDGDVLQAVRTHLADLPGHTESEFILLVSTDDALAERLITELPLDERQILGVLSLTQSLTKPVPLNAKHPAQLLPPVPIVTTPRLLSLLSITCLTLAACLGYGPVQHWQEAQAQRAAETKELRALAADRDDPTQPDFLPWVRFVLHIETTLPQDLVLTSLEADRQGFTLSGGSGTGAIQPAVERWQQAFTRNTAGWAFQVQPDGPAAFTAKGNWR